MEAKKRYKESPLFGAKVVVVVTRRQLVSWATSAAVSPTVAASTKGTVREIVVISVDAFAATTVLVGIFAVFVYSTLSIFSQNVVNNSRVSFEGTLQTWIGKRKVKRLSKLVPVKAIVKLTGRGSDRGCLSTIIHIGHFHHLALHLSNLCFFLL